jgi:hypothetical protein
MHNPILFSNLLMVYFTFCFLLLQRLKQTLAAQQQQQLQQQQQQLQQQQQQQQQLLQQQSIVSSSCVKTEPSFMATSASVQSPLSISLDSPSIESIVASLEPVR